jgi:hypothetical protein
VAAIGRERPLRRCLCDDSAPAFLLVAEVETDRIPVAERVDSDPELGGEPGIASLLRLVPQPHEGDGRVVVDPQHQALIERVPIAQTWLTADRDELGRRHDLWDMTGSERRVHDVGPCERERDRAAHVTHPGVTLWVVLVGRFDRPGLAVADDLAQREAEPLPCAPVEQGGDVACRRLGTQRPQSLRHVLAPEALRRLEAPPSEQ